MTDPIVDEVRANRAKIAAACEYDIGQILEHARQTSAALTGFKYVTHDELKARRLNRDHASLLKADERLA